MEELFRFLTEDYGMQYCCQVYPNCYGGSWMVYTHSFYNENGCFTVYRLPQRGELEFYCSACFGSALKELCQRQVDVFGIEPEIWRKHTKIGPFNRPFFWLSEKKVLRAFAEALKIHLQKEKDLFGISV